MDEHRVLAIALGRWTPSPDDRDKLAELVDSTWEGPVPYTLLIAPGGKIVRRWKDEIKPADLKSEISNALGKTYASKK